MEDEEKARPFYIEESLRRCLCQLWLTVCICCSDGLGYTPLFKKRVCVNRLSNFLARHVPYLAEALWGKVHNTCIDAGQQL